LQYVHSLPHPKRALVVVAAFLVVDGACTGVSLFVFVFWAFAVLVVVAAVVAAPCRRTATFTQPRLLLYRLQGRGQVRRGH